VRRKDEELQLVGVYFLSAEIASVAGASVAAAAGAGVNSSVLPALKSGSSPMGPLVALMPGAGFVFGIAGGSS